MSTLPTPSPAGQPNIIFIHGGGLSARMWQPQIESLSEFTCHAPDLLDHGSRRGQSPFDLEIAALEISTLIEEKIPTRRAHVVGLSIGGAVVLTLLRKYPQVVETAMVSGTAAGLEGWLGKISRASLWTLRLLKPETLVRASIKQFGIPIQYQAFFAEDMLHSIGVDFNRTLIDNLMKMRLPERIESPLLVAVGQNETMPARQAARKLVRKYPQATGVVVPHLGHVWNLQDPDLFNRTVRAWVIGKDLPAELEHMD